MPEEWNPEQIVFPTREKMRAHFASVGLEKLSGARTGEMTVSGPYAPAVTVTPRRARELLEMAKEGLIEMTPEDVERLENLLARHGA